MKGYTVLLCLALPSAILGSIFKQPSLYPVAKTFVNTALDYIDQVPYAVPQYYQYAAKNSEQMPSSSSELDSDQDQEQPSQQQPQGRSYQEFVRYGDPIDLEYAQAHHPIFSLKRNNNINMVNKYADAVAWKGVMMAAGPHGLVEDEQGIQKFFSDAMKSMKPIKNEQKMEFHNAVMAVSETDNEDAHLNATELLNKYEYPVEEHIVKTDDGYYLTLFRIPPQSGRSRTQKNEVVFLMHGILGSADDWLLMGPGKSIAYLLADAGYDVYLGNARGNKYSRRHASKHPAQKDFWKFSADEIALHDLPAMIDYALRTSESDGLYYVGHSLGTIAFFGLVSAHPEYNDKIKMMFAMSPMAYMAHTRSPFFKMIAPNNDVYEKMIERLGQGEFAPRRELIQYAGGQLCAQATGCNKVCSNALLAMAGVNVEQLDTKSIPVILGHSPAGTSMRVMKQFGQGVASRDFRRYDYGAEVNEKVYGARVPPSYELEEVRVPIVLYSSEADWLAHPLDVQHLQSRLPNVIQHYTVPDQYFGHMDFQVSKHAPEYIYKRLIDTIQQHNSY